MSLDISSDMFEYTELTTAATFKTATINVIFDNEFSAARTIGDIEIEAAGPQALCKTSDVSAAVHNDTLVIGGVTYYIKGIEPDGLGVTTLILSKSNVD